MSFIAALRRPPRALPRITASQMRALTLQQWQEVLAGPAEEAARWLAAGAYYGLVEAQTALGQILLDGRGVARDAPAAAHWFAIAATAGHAPAHNMLGRCCEQGWGLAVDYPRAASCYHAAAEAGLDWGQYNLANMLLRGRGVPQNRTKSLAWFCRAASQGHVKSINLVGRFHEEGWEIPKDRAAARNCYARAAEGGDFRGQYNLASLLAADGDIAGAVAWLRCALALAPNDFLDVMANRLASSDILELRAVGEVARKKAVLF
jgi:TPR repeat protein